MLSYCRPPVKKKQDLFVIYYWEITSFIIRYFSSLIEILGQLCSFSLLDEFKTRMTMSEHLPKKLV